jgi:hypothetical protein
VSRIVPKPPFGVNVAASNAKELSTCFTCGNRAICARKALAPPSLSWVDGCTSSPDGFVLRKKLGYDDSVRRAASSDVRETPPSNATSKVTVR